MYVMYIKKGTYLIQLHCVMTCALPCVFFASLFGVEIQEYAQIRCRQSVSYKVKMQYVQCRLIASYFLFPWRNLSEMSR